MTTERFYPTSFYLICLIVEVEKHIHDIYVVHD